MAEGARRHASAAGRGRQHGVPSEGP
jgi:hypothetical protein